MSTDDDDSLFQRQNLLPPLEHPQNSPSANSSGLGVEEIDDDDDDDDDNSNPSYKSHYFSLSKDDQDAIPSLLQSANFTPAPDSYDCYRWLYEDPEIKCQRKRNDSSSGSSSLSPSSAGISSLPMPDPPDGGWGWMVVLGAFVVNLICDGLAYSFGVLFTELIDKFGESRSKTSWVGSIFFGVPMILGPLASALTTRFGCRKMTIVGGLVASFGCILSYFATSVDMLCFTFSTIVGVGFSFCYVTSVIIVAFYFERHRALATGIAVCGTGCGTFTFAPFMSYLLSEYDIHGLFLIMAGVCLNLVVCGMLFRPLCFTESERLVLLRNEFSKIPESRGDLERARSRYTSESASSDYSDDPIDEETRTLSVLNLPTFVSKEAENLSSNVLMEALKFSRNPDLTVQRYMKNAVLRHSEPDCIKLPVRNSHSPSNSRTYTISSPISLSTTSKNDDSARLVKKIITDEFVDKTFPKQISSVTSHGKEIQTETFLSKDNKPHFLNITSCEPSKTKNNDLEKAKSSLLPMPVVVTEQRSQIVNSRTNIVHSSKQTSGVHKIPGLFIGRHQALSIHLPLYRSDIFYRRFLRPDTPVDTCTLGTSCPEFTTTGQRVADRSAMYRAAVLVYEETGDLLGNMVDTTLFRKPFFNIFVLSNFLFYFWNDVPYMYASDYAQTKGVDEWKAAFLISIIGICNTVGQLFFGYIGDLKVNLLNIYAVASIFEGIFVALVPFTDTYWMMSVTYGAFGFFVSVSFPLTTVLMVEFLGVDKLTNAYGLLMLSQGIANLGGPPVAGWVSDVTQTYAPSFYLAAGFFVASGLVLFTLYCRWFKPKIMQGEVSTSTNDKFGNSV